MQLRAWKRRQKILKGGDNRIDLLTGSRDSVAKDSLQEFQDESKASNSSETSPEISASVTTSAESEDGATAVAPAEPKLASWEKKWNKAAENAPKVELPEAPPVESIHKKEDSENNSNESEDLLPKKDSELRQRKGQDAESKAPTIGSADRAVAGKADGELASEETTVSMNALREKLRRDRVGLVEFWVRQAVLVIGALLLAWHFVQIGGIVSPNHDVAQVKVADDLFDEDSEDEVRLSFGDDDDDDTHGSGVGHAMFSQHEMIPSAAGGYLSIPVAIFILRAAIHLLFVMGAGIKFSLVEAAKYPIRADANAGGMLSRAAAFFPPLAQAVETSALVRAVVDDTLLFVFIFVVSISVWHQF